MHTACVQAFAKVTNMPLFAAWDARVLQHALLFPFPGGLVLGLAASAMAADGGRDPLASHSGNCVRGDRLSAMIVSELLLGSPECMNTHGSLHESVLFGTHFSCRCGWPAS